MSFKFETRIQMGFSKWLCGVLHLQESVFSISKSVDSLAVIRKGVKKGLRIRKKGTGNQIKAYNPLLLFKMQLTRVWYNLSDVQTETVNNAGFHACQNTSISNNVKLIRISLWLMGTKSL